MLVCALMSAKGCARWAESEPLVILHTNDTHSRLDPFEEGEFKGMGGVARRKTLFDCVRHQMKNVIVMDAGDYFQGTPYFNMWRGRLEIEAMNRLGYDVVVIGNHEFDAGVENLAEKLSKASFEVVVCNYECRGTPLEGIVKPYTVIERGEWVVGVVGVGVELEGLVPASLYGGVRWRNPIPVVNKLARQLKREGCNLVVALTHIGYSYSDERRLCDVYLARHTCHVDLIVGGHTHTFLKQMSVVRNRCGEGVGIVQAGWGGVVVGQLLIYKGIRATDWKLTQC